MLNVLRFIIHRKIYYFGDELTRHERRHCGKGAFQTLVLRKECGEKICTHGKCRDDHRKDSFSFVVFHKVFTSNFRENKLCFALDDIAACSCGYEHAVTFVELHSSLGQAVCGDFYAVFGRL